MNKSQNNYAEWSKKHNTVWLHLYGNVNSQRVTESVSVVTWEWDRERQKEVNGKKKWGNFMDTHIVLMCWWFLRDKQMPKNTKMYN